MAKVAARLRTGAILKASSQILDIENIVRSPTASAVAASAHAPASRHGLFLARRDGRFEDAVDRSRRGARAPGHLHERGPRAQGTARERRRGGPRGARGGGGTLGAVLERLSVLAVHTRENFLREES
jgi:hypothetical protein